MGRIIAIDYGRKRCGVAVTDVLKIAANGLPTQRTLRPYGIPAELRFKGTCGAYRGRVAQDIVRNTFRKHAVYHTFSSKARENVSGHSCGNFRRAFHFRHCPSRDVGRRREESDRQRKDLADQTAATIILTDYLNSRSFNCL